MQTHLVRMLWSLLALSVALNVAMVTRMVSEARRPGSSERREPTPPVARQKSRVGSRLASLPATPSSATPSEFHWHQLESPEYAVYIKNLRQIGCPEETIRDLVIAEIHKNYAPRLSAIAAEVGRRPFWKSGSTRRKILEETEQKLRALNQEKREVLHALLGSQGEDPFAQFNPATLLQEELELGFVTGTKREQVRDALRRHQEKQRALDRQFGGLIGPKDQAEMVALQKSLQTELAGLLSPQEYEAYQMQHSLSAENVRSKLDGFDVNEEEFRQMFKIRQAYDDAVARIQDAADPSGPTRQQLRDQRDAQLQELLGTDRYADYQKNQDMDYRALSRVASQQQLPPETVNEAYDIKRQSEQAMNRLFQDNSLTPENRRDAVAAIQSETETALRRMLGDQGYESYRRNNSFVIDTGANGVIRTVTRAVDGTSVQVRDVLSRPPGSGPVRVNVR